MDGWVDLGACVVLCSRLHQSFSFFKGSKLRMGLGMVLAPRREGMESPVPRPGSLPLYPSPCVRTC